MGRVEEMHQQGLVARWNKFDNRTGVRFRMPDITTFNIDEMLDYLKDRHEDVTLSSNGPEWILMIWVSDEEQSTHTGTLRQVVRDAFSPYLGAAIEARRQRNREWGESEKVIEEAFRDHE